jgi:hypothetical protein
VNTCCGSTRTVIAAQRSPGTGGPGISAASRAALATTSERSMCTGAGLPEPDPAAAHTGGTARVLLAFRITPSDAVDGRSLGSPCWPPVWPVQLEVTSVPGRSLPDLTRQMRADECHRSRCWWRRARRFRTASGRLTRFDPSAHMNEAAASGHPAKITKYQGCCCCPVSLPRALPFAGGHSRLLCPSVRLSTTQAIQVIS